MVITRVMTIYNFMKKNLGFKEDSIKDKNLKIGDFTYGIPKIYIWNDKYHVVIGKFCSISKNVQIIVDGNHRTDWITTYPFGNILEDIPKNPCEAMGKGNIIIGNDVWIGMDVTILPGIKVGDGAVIGAGSMVTKNIKDYEIVAGNPARHVRYRFDKNQIKQLKKIRWWDWPIEKIKDEINMLESTDIEKFIKKYEH